MTGSTHPRRRWRGAAAAGIAAVALLVAAQAAAVPAGTGVRGTVTASWGGITGSPITAWEGGVDLVFDPSPRARAETLAAAADPALGEPTRPLFGAQVQAARVTRLASDKAETVVCTTVDETGQHHTWDATATSSVASVADGRVAWEILPPKVDLLRGRGDIWLQPYGASDPNGWWVADRFALPGRWAGPGTWPCPGDGAPSARLPRVIALNGQGAVPRAVSDWLNEEVWQLRRTGGAWRVVMEGSRRVTFSESPFGPQDSQQLTVTLRSDLRLTGSLARLGARCKAPRHRIRTARSARQAVALAKRAGMARTRFTGTRHTLYEGWRPYFTVAGPIDSMSHYPCGKGAFRITRHAPRR